MGSLKKNAIQNKAEVEEKKEQRIYGTDRN